MIEENQMAHSGTLRDFQFIQSGEDLDDVRGSHLYGLNDEKLGKIGDVIFDHSSGDIRYVVVATGGWLSSKKFIVPTGFARRRIMRTISRSISASSRSRAFRRTPRRMLNRKTNGKITRTVTVPNGKPSL